MHNTLLRKREHHSFHIVRIRTAAHFTQNSKFEIMLYFKKLVLESLQELYKISLINHIIYSNTFP